MVISQDAQDVVITANGQAIANLVISQDAQDVVITANGQAIANLEISQDAQDVGIDENTQAIANLELSQDAQDVVIGENTQAIANLNTSQSAQDVVITANGQAIANLNTSQSAQDVVITANGQAIANLVISQDAQDVVIGSNGQAIANLEISQDAQDVVIGNNGQAITNLEISQDAQDVVIGNNGQAIANLEISQDAQDVVIGNNGQAITVLNAQSGITSGVDIQYTETRPLLNSKGQPPKNGDLWKKKSQDWGEFDDMQWVSPKHYLASSSQFGGTSAFSLPLSIPFLVTGNTPVANIKIISVDVLLTAVSAVDSNNFWLIESFSRSIQGGDTPNSGGSYTLNQMSNNNKWQRLIQNRVLSASSLGSLFIRLTRSSTSTPVLCITHSICYAHVL